MPLITDHIRLPRPQPFGILPIPAGLLILPDAGNNDARLRLQAMAHDTSLNIPQQWAFYPLAEREDWAGVLSQLASAEDDISAYNRFVIAPTIDELSKLRHSLTGELRLLVEVAAYALGLEDTIAEEESLAATLNGELLALALMTAAAAEMERGSDAKAIPILERAIAAARPTSPLFAAQLLGQLGQVCSTQPEPYHSQTQGHLKEALALMQEAPFPSLKADLWMQLGMHYQENAQGRHDWSNEAISAYQEVLRSGLVPEEHRELFALAHNNLGLLFLSRRMSENGRPLSMAIALQSFREGSACAISKHSPNCIAPCSRILRTRLSTCHPGIRKKTLPRQSTSTRSC